MPPCEPLSEGMSLRRPVPFEGEGVSVSRVTLVNGFRYRWEFTDDLQGYGGDVPTIAGLQVYDHGLQDWRSPEVVAAMGDNWFECMVSTEFSMEWRVVPPVNLPFVSGVGVLAGSGNVVIP